METRVGGELAEWLRSGLQIRARGFDSPTRLQKSHNILRYLRQNGLDHVPRVWCTIRAQSARSMCPAVAHFWGIATSNRHLAGTSRDELRHKHRKCAQETQAG